MKIIGVLLSILLALCGGQLNIPQKEEPPKLSLQLHNIYRDQYIGRWVIPEVNVDVACYQSYSQAVVDREDSAAIFEQESGYAIGDHWNQGFISITKCKPGMRAVLKTPEGDIEYECVSVIEGLNGGPYITDVNGVHVSDISPGGVYCYTCQGATTWKNLYIALFQPV